MTQRELALARKLWRALIVGYEITNPVFWFWEMAVDIFNCSKVGRKGEK